MKTALKKLGSVIFATLLSACFSPPSSADEAGKPVALVGHSYGIHEVKILINKVIVVSEEETYVYQNCGGNIPISELDKYSLLIVATSVSKALTDDEMEKLKSWVTNGGNLMLIDFAPISLCGGRDELQKKKLLSWAGIQSVRSVKAGISCKVIKTDAPFLKGVEFEKNNDGIRIWPENVNRIADVIPPMRTIIGDASSCFVGIAQVGKGTVSYFGGELFRMYRRKPELSVKYMEIMRNAVRIARPLSQNTMKTAMLEKSAWGDTPLLLWNREWNRGEEYGPRFTPPMPEQNEIIGSLSADMAIDEYETLQLNLTPLKDFKEISFSLESKDVPKENLEFLVQEKPNPIPWPKKPGIAKEFPFWLIPPEHLEGKMKNSFALPKAGETKIVWLRINSHGIKPGDYKIGMNFQIPGEKTIQLPVDLKVYPVTLPRKRLIKLEASGQVYGDVNRAAPALRFTKDLEAHGVEWSRINVLRPATFKIQGTTEFLTTQYMESHKKDFEAGKYPELDMTALDPWMEQAIGHGLIYFKVPPSFYELEKLGFKKENIDKIEQWYISQASGYMKEKGLRIFIANYGDELNLQELKTVWEPWARKLTKYGWDCTSSFSAGGVYVDYFNEISPFVKLWTLNQRYTLFFIEKVKTGELKLRRDAIIGSYGAGEGRGSEFRKPLGKSRYLGWISWLNGVQNCSVNPYFKGWLYYLDYGNKGEAGGVGGERFVSYIDKDDMSVPLAACPFWEGVREGMEEGNLCAVLSWYIEHLEKVEAEPASKAKKAREKLAQIIGPSENSIIKWKEAVRYKYPVKEIKASSADYKKAKKEILELLLSLKDDAQKYIRPSLYWNDTELIHEGKAVAAIYYDKIKPDVIVKAIKKLSGIELPSFNAGGDLNDKYKTAIIIGNASQNPLSKKILDQNQSRDADNNYPGAGSYYIREFENSGNKTFIIAGPEEEGTKKE